MKTLLLLRHAKSSWDDMSMSDHDRPLNKRGRRGAEAMGRWLTNEKLEPDEVLSSDAARTLETWDMLNLPGSVTPRADLYHAGPAAMMDCLQGASGDRVLMIGHNPGIAGFAAQLVSERPDHARFGQYPTAALLVADFDVDSWAGVTWHSGTVRRYLTPHDLGIVKK